MTNAAADKLTLFLERYRKNGPHPILWVGAGASAAAGYPTLGQLEELLRKELPGETATGFELIDRYIADYSETDLVNFLQQHLGVPKGPAPIHEAIARLAQAAVLGPLFTTNYDRLIEQALTTLKVAHTVQVLEQNFVLQARQDVQLLKLHGDQGDWQKVVLSAASYADFEQCNPLLRHQLDLSLRTHPVVFVGCSLRDPRVLGWLRSLSASERGRLFASRVLITTRDWAQIPAEDQALLRQSNVQPILVDDHAAVTRTMQEVARRLAPLAAQELVFTITPTDAEWTVVGPTAESEPHRASNPLKDAAFVAKLVQLRAQAPLAIIEDHPAAATQEAQARLLASELGAKLTALLLSDSAKQQVTRRIHDKDRGRARLILRVHSTDDAQQSALTEQALALPWELLMPESGAFAVERCDLDVVREIVTQGAPELPVK